MNDHETTVLTSRLHQLADGLTPPLDVVAQVRGARAGHRRRRRTRIALVAVATATAVVLVGLPLTIGSLNSAPSGRAAGPAPATTAPATTAREEAERRAVEEALRRAQQAAEQHTGSSVVIPDGWESHTLRGATFAVPPDARRGPDVDQPDYFSWSGPVIGDGPYGETISLGVARVGGVSSLPDGSEPLTVRGAREAFVRLLGQEQGGADPALARTVEMTARTTDGVVTVNACFPPGPVGEQMARDFFGSIDLTSMAP